MSSFTEVIATIREEFRHRYRGLLGIPFVLALAYEHWRVIAYIATETPRSADLIRFIESQVSFVSIWWSLVYASAYVIIYPWLEHFVARIASRGRRRRDEFQAQEIEDILGKRKTIADKEAQLVERELKTKIDQSKKADIDRALAYQAMLGEQALERAKNDALARLSIDNYVEAMRQYIERSDQIEGQFVNKTIQAEHTKFVTELSTLRSIFQRHAHNQFPNEEFLQSVRQTTDQQKKYRQLVRDIYEI